MEVSLISRFPADFPPLETFTLNSHAQPFSFPDANLGRPLCVQRNE